ncbi:hypothetical protein [Priestia aryabhattai]|uniref:Uncharacterized protein n=1 Tax=Priestia aryabhattai TaxID=412384 RepID=A0ABD7X4M1_PRIAR|nr:hypothetical protein [Priestia aryabhattai]WEA47267.1 hypothetical protein PWO00_28530 [Priestia aryabhattai]
MPSIKVQAGATIGKLQIMECHKYNDEGKEISYKYIDIKPLKDDGIIKKANSFKKAEAFLNTPEGIEFYDISSHMRIW